MPEEGMRFLEAVNADQWAYFSLPTVEEMLRHRYDYAWGTGKRSQSPVSKSQTRRAFGDG